MHVGMKLGVGLAASVLAGGALTAGAVAGAVEAPEPGQQEASAAPPQTPQDAPPQQTAPEQDIPLQEAPPQNEQQEEGHGPGAIEVGPEGAAKAMDRLLQRGQQRVRWCRGSVLPSNGLNVRTGPGLRYRIVGALRHHTTVWTDWDTIERRDGYLWVRMSEHRWIADYKLGNGNGKWYIRYHNC